MNQDEDHLKLLSIFHYVVGGLAGFFALFPIFHLAIGLFFVIAPENFVEKGEAPPEFIGWFFVVFSAVFITGIQSAEPALFSKTPLARFCDAFSRCGELVDGMSKPLFLRFAVGQELNDADEAWVSEVTGGNVEPLYVAGLVSFREGLRGFSFGLCPLFGKRGRARFRNGWERRCLRGRRRLFRRWRG